MVYQSPPLPLSLYIYTNFLSLFPSVFTMVAQTRMQSFLFPPSKLFLLKEYLANIFVDCQHIWACHNFIDAVRSHMDSRPETKDLLLTAKTIARVWTLFYTDFQGPVPTKWYTKNRVMLVYTVHLLPELREREPFIIGSNHTCLSLQRKHCFYPLNG